MTYSYQPEGVCCKKIEIELTDDDIVKDVKFTGGCNGNAAGIATLVKGMRIDDVILKLKGITCGARKTSCPDQLATALEKFKNEK